MYEYLIDFVVCLGAAFVFWHVHALPMRMFVDLKRIEDAGARDVVLRNARRNRNCTWARAVLGSTSMIAAAAFFRWRGPTFGSWLVMAVCGAAGFDIGDVLLCKRTIEQRIRRHMNQSGFRLCLGCGYDLQGTATDLCPECGAPAELTRTPA